MQPISPIGTIHSPYVTIEDMPIQPKGAEGIEGNISVAPEYAEGLRDLIGFSHIYLIYHFHRARRQALHVTPFMDTEPRGVFSTRSPLRPNHIGLSIVKLLAVDGNKVIIEGVDVLDGTPLLDIKPYIKQFDEVTQSRSGWMQASEHAVSDKRSDKRFE